MRVTETNIPEVLIFEPQLFADERGWFMESFNEKIFHQELAYRKLEIPASFVQDNHSYSHKNVLRGLHYQLAPFEQGKLVRVVSGSVLDVAIDLRENSKTFGHHVKVVLSADNKKLFWIPPGFAHGFLTLEDNTHFLYKTTAFYSKEHERAIRWSDLDLGIDWSLNLEPIVHAKDASAPTFKNRHR